MVKVVEIKDQNKLNKFRLNCLNLLLTYPNNSLLNDIIIQHIDIKFKDKVFGYVIAYEEGSSGYSHIHVFVKLRKKCDIRDPNYLDLNGIHGNYTSVRNVSKCIEYIIKDNKYTAYNVDIHRMIIKGIKRPFEKFIYMCRHNIIDQATAYDMIDPKCSKDLKVLCDYYDRPNKYRNFLQDYYMEKYIPNVTVEIKESIYDQLKRWYQSKDKALYVHSKTGLGKTTLFVIVFKDKLMLIRHKDANKGYNPCRHSVALFDDYKMNNLKPEYIINMIDTHYQNQLDVKNNMVSLGPNTRIILTSNLKPDDCFFRKKKSIRGISEKDNYYGFGSDAITHYSYNEVDPEHVNAIKRRIEELHLVEGDIYVHKKPITPRPGYIAVNYQTMLDWV